MLLLIVDAIEALELPVCLGMVDASEDVPDPLIGQEGLELAYALLLPLALIGVELRPVVGQDLL